MNIRLALFSVLNDPRSKFFLHFSALLQYTIFTYASLGTSHLLQTDKGANRRLGWLCPIPLQKLKFSGLLALLFYIIWDTK